MNIIIYYSESKNNDYIIIYRNHPIKPSKGELLIINKKYYVVEGVTIDYDNSNIYVAVRDL